MSHSLSRFKDVLENYTRNAYEEIKENKTQNTDQIEEDKGEEFTKLTEEDQSIDEDITIKPRVRSYFQPKYF